MTSKIRAVHCTSSFNIFYANIHRLALVKRYIGNYSW